jgi:uncharacterized metal-binding protein YceD (DUF177 family)
MFCIPFSGLSFGRHTFDFHVNDMFFETFNYEEISNCDINIKLDFEKTERFLKLDFYFSGKYSVPCDRCLDLVEIPVNHDETQIVNFGNETDFDSEVWIVSPKEHELILDKYIYETLVLLRPFSVMHDIKNCNPDMLKQLQPTSSKTTETDPRWDALKMLKSKSASTGHISREEVR